MHSHSFIRSGLSKKFPITLHSVLIEERLQELIKNYIREIGEEPVFYTITDIRPVAIE